MHHLNLSITLMLSPSTPYMVGLVDFNGFHNELSEDSTSTLSAQMNSGQTGHMGTLLSRTPYSHSEIQATLGLVHNMTDSV